MKKLMVLFLTVMIFISITACSGQKDFPSAKEEVQDNSESYFSSVDLSSDISGEITVSCYDTMLYKNYLEEAAQAFENQYPNIKINIETFSAMPEVTTTTSEDGQVIAMMQAKKEDDNSKNDYINKINTELMSGEGADVLAMDILPYYQYVENGQLENLSPYMENDKRFDLSKYRQNIMEGTKYKNGQYFFPMDYSYGYLSYDTTLLGSKAQEKIKQQDTFTYEELTKIALDSFHSQESSKEPLRMYDFRGGLAMFGILFEEHYNEFIHLTEKTVSFDDGNFAKILETVKEYEEKGYINESTDYSAKSLMDGTSAIPKFYYQKNNPMALLQNFDDSAAHGSFGGKNEDIEIGGLFSNEQGGVNFEVHQGYGINTNSQNKKIAWEFIKFLASEEMQTSMNLLGQPINNQAAEKRAKLEITGQLFNPEENNGIAELTEEQERIYQEYTAVLNKFADQLNTYLMKDSTIDEMVSSEVASFFDGTKTAEEVAETLQNKVTLYLNE